MEKAYTYIFFCFQYTPMLSKPAFSRRPEKNFDWKYFYFFLFAFFADVMSTADTFSDDGVTSYSQLLFDIARKQMVVGARYVYRVRLYTYYYYFYFFFFPRYISSESNETRDDDMWNVIIIQCSYNTVTCEFDSVIT